MKIVTSFLDRIFVGIGLKLVPTFPLLRHSQLDWESRVLKNRTQNKKQQLSNQLKLSFHKNTHMLFKYPGFRVVAELVEVSSTRNDEDHGV